MPRRSWRHRRLSDGSRFVTIPRGGDTTRKLRVHPRRIGARSAERSGCRVLAWQPVVVVHLASPDRCRVAAGYRVIAPDLVGMGLSDKPTEMTDYTVFATSSGCVPCSSTSSLSGATLRAARLGRHHRHAPRRREPRPGRAAGDLQHRFAVARPLTEPLPDVIEAIGPFADFQEFARTRPSGSRGRCCRW